MIQNKYVRLVKKGIKNPEKIIPFLKIKKYDFWNQVLQPRRNLNMYMGSTRGIGTNIFQFNWDLLIILDTCRVDALRAVQDEYDFINDVDSYQSVGSHSGEFMANTFDKEYSNKIKNTALISANPHSNSVFRKRLKQNWELEDKAGGDEDIVRLNKYGRYNFVQPDDFDRFEELWKYTDDEYRYCPPRPVTDRGIEISREQTNGKIILHYMPPHIPYPDKVIPKGSDVPNYPLIYLKKTGRKKKVYEAYLNNLRWVLDDVKLLLQNTEHSNVLITADHGEAFGEYGVYEHPAGSLHPHIRQVPLVQTSATDTGSHDPTFSLQGTERSARDQLSALGYI
jgi:hypothetical protein